MKILCFRYYDVELGKGSEAIEGSRVAVHYDAYWKGITFMTSRQVSYFSRTLA